MLCDFLYKFALNRAWRSTEQRLVNLQVTYRLARAPMSTANPSTFTAPVVVVTSFVVLLLPLLASSAKRPPSSIPKSDIDAVQVALNLEFLEAEFFCYSSLGYGLDTIQPSVTDGGPRPYDVQKAQLDSFTRDIMTQFCYQEVDHIMGILAVVPGFARPQLELSRYTFAKIMNLAFETDLSPPFDVYANALNFLLGSYLIPYVGHNGYIEASPNLKSPEVKKLVTSLESVEAGQDVVIRFMLYQCQKDKWLGCSEVRPYGIPVAEFTRKLSALRDSLGSNGNKDEGIIVQLWQGAQKNITGNVIAGNMYSEGYGRTPAEIFRIVYGTASEYLPGGFFPYGCNGAIAKGFLTNPP